MRKSSRGSVAVKTDVRLWGLTREWGQDRIQIPAFNQYRGHRDPYPLAKASHWGNLRRQGIESFEMRVGRPTGIDRIFAKNGYGDVLPVFLGMTAITFFILAEK